MKKVNKQDFKIKSRFTKIDVGIDNNGVFVFTNLLTPKEFANYVKKHPNEIISYFFKKGEIVNLNTNLTKEQIGEYCLECGFDFRFEDPINEINFLDNIEEYYNNFELKKRAPIITIMGHVDHGKTTLLDYLRNSKIVDHEFGSITQHLGAYQVIKNNEKITFIDTPGHEAFTQMRSRGANVTDIVILVVGADDGVMPQTIEAIDHAKTANSPIIIFVNKIDKPSAKPEKVISQLSEHGLLCEDLGGDIPVVKGSALTGLNVDLLLDVILLTAEMLELKACYDANAYGIVLESYLDKGLGPVANVIVKNGTLHIGDFVIVGDYYGKIRKIFNEFNKKVDFAYPSTPVMICGLNGLPNPSDKFIVCHDEKDAKEIIEKRINSKKNLTPKNNNPIITKDENNKILNLIIKTDFFGTTQAIANILKSIKVEDIKLNIVRLAVGAVSKSDISLAKVSNAIIYSFNITCPKEVYDFAKSEDVIIKFHNIIYHMKDEIEAFLTKKLDPIFNEEITGNAEVREIWKHSKIGTIAGCMVLSGEIERNSFARVLRNNTVIIEKTKIDSLKSNKNSIKKIEHGKECGIVLENFNDIEKNDIIQTYKYVKKT